MAMEPTKGLREVTSSLAAEFIVVGDFEERKDGCARARRNK